jgi:hypothetical protein
MKKETLAQILTYSGILPFLCAAIIPVIQPDFLTLDYNDIILTYGAVIASFIAGIHWGVYMFKDTQINLFIHSNIAALMAWFAAVVAIPGSAGILIVCFSYLLFIDKQLAKVNVIEPWYMRMRIIASTLVILALACTILFP